MGPDPFIWSRGVSAELLPKVYLYRISPTALDAIARLVREQVAAALTEAGVARAQLAPGALSGRASAAYLGISKSKLYEVLGEDPSFPAPIRIGRRILFRIPDLDAWLERQRLSNGEMKRDEPRVAPPRQHTLAEAIEETAISSPLPDGLPRQRDAQRR
jgi:predicted DNA-binding transcriptional regulator AlpA